ncbi:integrase [Pseudomonas amygdali]|uniref:integrase n=1 Tax=Pseudomonas amygdali TaxID=47877 RepID=UPI00128F6020|nr:integrase [Pseudomonas amygdali]
MSGDFAKLGSLFQNFPSFDFLPLYRNCDYREHNAATCKKIFIIRMFSPFYNPGRALRISSMHAARFMLLNMSEFCANKNIKIDKIFESLETYKSFHDTQPILGHKQLTSLVRCLSRLTDRERGFGLDRAILPFIQKQVKNSNYKSQQTPVIPSRILLFKYNQYQSYISDFLDNVDSIKKILEKSVENPLYGKNPVAQYHPKARGFHATDEQKRQHLMSPFTFEMAIKENNLFELSNKYNWTRMSNITAFLSLAGHCAKNLIHIFTLMRDHEVKNLSMDCLSPTRGWNNEALYVASITTKLYGAKKPRQWITTDAIVKPVEVLTKILEILSPYTNNPENYLLVSTTVHPASHNNKPSNGPIKRGRFEIHLPEILIEEGDIQELETIEPLRNWRGDPRFKIGQPWKVASHQFRRTMAVFSAQTGLITLPSLKRLLGHITSVMSLYYTKGCSAQNYHFNLMNPRLAKEMRQAAQEADGAMFIREALNSTEKLYGFKGAEIWRNNYDSVWLRQSIEETLELVELGLASWTPTGLGGCTYSGSCIKRLHGNYYSCITCRELVAKESVMNETVEIMEYDLKQLDPQSIEYKAEKRNLEDFIDLRSRIIAKFS